VNDSMIIVDFDTRLCQCAEAERDARAARTETRRTITLELTTAEIDSLFYALHHRSVACAERCADPNADERIVNDNAEESRRCGVLARHFLSPR